MKLKHHIQNSFIAGAAIALPSIAFSHDEEGANIPHGDLAKAAQNPVAAMISVPIQGTFNFGTGAGSDTAYTTLIEPVIPQSLNDEWNWIHRGLIPVPAYSLGVNDVWGLGDIQYEGFLSPAQPGSLIWGVGPYLSFPTTTSNSLGTGKWSAGPALLALTMPGDWVIGGLVTQLWSYAGQDDREDVNQTAIQYFATYNIPNGNGWYVTSSPTNVFNWEADSGDRVTIPLGGGFGRVFKVGDQHLNARVQGFGYADAPTGGPDWSLQFQLTLLFPE